jgi:hypothetical protein
MCRQDGEQEGWQRAKTTNNVICFRSLSIFMILSFRFHVATSNVEPNDEQQALFVVIEYFMSVPMMRSLIHAGERTVRHARIGLMREQQTTTHTLTNTLNTPSFMVHAPILQIWGLKVLGNTQMFCIIEFHFYWLSLQIFNTKFTSVTR